MGFETVLFVKRRHVTRVDVWSAAFPTIICPRENKSFSQPMILVIKLSKFKSQVRSPLKS